MGYDYRNRAGPAYRPAGDDSAGSLHQRVGQRGHPPVFRAPCPRPASSASPSSGLGIRVAIKPEYQITSPPQVAPQVAEVPQSMFQFDFGFEKKVLAEAERDNQNYSRFAVDGQSSKTAPSTSSEGSTGDPVVDKYVASGLGREAVSLAVLNYGDNPPKVREFAKGYNLLREMGFSTKNVAEALAIYDNDTDGALAYLLNSSS